MSGLEHRVIDEDANILVTGGAGVLGEAIVERLSGHRVTCLAHRNHELPGHATIVSGDLRRRSFGLDRTTYGELVARTTHVVHCAAMTSFAARPDVIHAINTQTTCRVLEFAHASSARVVHVSTAFVERLRREGSPAPPSVHDGPDVSAGIQAYVSSKRDAERHVLASGLPVAIVRPSLLTGDSSGGRVPRFQGIQLISRFLFDGKLPLVPADRRTRVDFLPRDLVADAVIAVLARMRGMSEYWLTAGERALTLERLLAVTASFARQAGEPVRAPRFVGRDVVDRLIRPVFLEHLPRPSRRRMEFVLALLELFECPAPFHSDIEGLLPALEWDLEAAYHAGLSFWAQHDGAGTAHA